MIIGSGAGGGTVTKVLADLGVSVLLMEAGPMVSMGDFKMLHGPSSVWHRGAGEQAQLYTTGQGTPLSFNAELRRQHARRALHRRARQPVPLVPIAVHRRPHQPLLARAAALLRLRLQAAVECDGIGWDWPITYEDIAPYYDKAERLIGVTGKPEGIRSAPDGIFQEPAPLKPHEVLVQQACAKLGIRAINARQAVITRPLNGRPACIYCGQCGRGCAHGSNYASSYVQIFPAMKTGRVRS